MRVHRKSVVARGCGQAAVYGRGGTITRRVRAELEEVERLEKRQLALIWAQPKPVSV